MKKYKQFIVESKKDLTLEKIWFKAIENKDIDKVKELVNKGIDVNLRDHNGNTALILCSIKNIKIIPIILLNQPGIDINIQNKFGNTALILSCCITANIPLIKMLLARPEIDITIKNENNMNFLKTIDSNNKRTLDDYDLQKKIIENGRDDIILFFDKHGLLNDKIKEEYPDLFKAKDWGLIS